MGKLKKIVRIQLIDNILQKNTGQNGGKPKLDLNVAAAWALGITGKNITTAIMDDGKLWFLKPNFNNISFSHLSKFNKFIYNKLLRYLHNRNCNTHTHMLKK